MKARIIKQEGYRCAPEGARVVLFGYGETVTGKVAEWALADGAAQQITDPRTETKIQSPPETKATPKKRKTRKKAAD